MENQVCSVKFNLDITWYAHVYYICDMTPYAAHVCSTHNTHRTTQIYFVSGLLSTVEASPAPTFTLSASGGLDEDQLRLRGGRFTESEGSWDLGEFPDLLLGLGTGWPWPLEFLGDPWDVGVALGRGLSCPWRCCWEMAAACAVTSLCVSDIQTSPTASFWHSNP